MKRYDYMDDEKSSGLIVITFTDTNGLSKAQQDILDDGWLIENVDFSPSRAYFYVKKKCRHDSHDKNKQVYKVNDKFYGHDTNCVNANPFVNSHKAEGTCESNKNPVDEWMRLMFRAF